MNCAADITLGAGRMEFTIGGDRCVVEPGDEVFIPAGGCQLRGAWGQCKGWGGGDTADNGRIMHQLCCVGSVPLTTALQLLALCTAHCAGHRLLPPLQA